MTSPTTKLDEAMMQLTDEQIVEAGYMHTVEDDEPLFAFDRKELIAMVRELLSASGPAAPEGLAIGCKQRDALFENVTDWVTAHHIHFEAQNELFRIISDFARTAPVASAPEAVCVTRDAEITQLIDERDTFEHLGSALADKVAELLDVAVGEWSSANNPILRAIHTIEDRLAASAAAPAQSGEAVVLDSTHGWVLDDLACQCARNCTEWHDYLPLDAASERAFKPHLWVMDAMRAAISWDRKMNRSALQGALTDSEQYRMQMAGICTAALGHWKEGDTVHADYDTPALRDVASLYAKYAAFRETLASLAACVGMLMPNCQWTAHKEARKLLAAPQPTQPAQSAVQDERAAFEAWAKTENMDLTPFESTFDSDFTSNAWDGWQARAASPQATAPTMQQISDYLHSLDAIQREVVEREARAIGAKATATQPAQTELALTEAELTALVRKVENKLGIVWFVPDDSETYAWRTTNTNERLKYARALLAAAQPASGAEHD